MADKDGKADLPIIPGQVYVEVEYDYEYKAKDKMIVIKQGEHYILVKKTNEDWWQVKQDENTKPFYVPAQYVKELRKALMPPQKPLLSSPSGSLKVKSSALDIQPSHRSNENLAKTPELSSFGKHPPALPRDGNQNLAPGSSPGLSRRGGEHHQNNNNTSRGGTDSPPPRIPNHNKVTTLGRETVLDVDAEKTPPHEHPHGSLTRDGSEKHRNDSESGDDLSSSSTEHMQTTSPTGQGRAESPVYANLQELKISQSSLPPVPSSSPLHTIGEWDTHKDLNGRHYYFNRATQERTWKPPRARDTSSSSSSSTRGEPQISGDQEPLSSEENCHSTYSSLSDSQYGSPPRGWSEELDEHGQTLYVSEYTNEKWIKHVDEQGRPYYYSADGSRSEWELPKVSKQAEERKPYKLSPPLPGEFPKSRSLDRKQVDPIVLTKWRHSTYVLDLSDKESPTTPKQGFPDSDSCPSSPKHPTAASEKCGVLNVTKITEHGKKVRKNWTSSWAVLQGSTLLFAKGQGGGTGWKFGGSQSKPEFTVDLRGAILEWASKDKSSKKRVLELKTRQGTELLIQSENDTVINDWFKALGEMISTHAWESDEAIEEDMPESPGADKHDKDSRDSKKSRTMKNSVSIDSSDQKKTRVKLKKFLTRRPTLQAVRDKGYIKDQVFGCNLTSLCQREKTTVPSFVRMCIDHLENNGLNVDGLYRVSGNLAVIQKLRFAINHDETLDLKDSKWEDTHVITGALKMFFRELPEPLFTHNYFDDFVSAIKSQDYEQRVQSIKDVIKQLPKPNQDTMQALFKHLRKVIEHGEENRMNTQSVAIVFGPTLLRPETETGNIAVHMVYQNQIVELILLEYESIFSR
ncbi:rho GTPase-activating protein 12-like isoform X4 [Acipenser ruthenus]|uniref:rho GTPase-activating protein 12-like isoform X4 n=1 Tax=Acipenser ruthenus TaxID=7906 RepID=UPI00274162E5|nr:rho GTPase-activating protein 12-like isoform X4 [Acipenser ruthenus]